jgi:hypothetical protein
MLKELLGPNAERNSQQSIEKAQRGLEDLRKDFGDGPEGKALDAYIRFFEQLSPARGAASQNRAPADDAPSRPTTPEDPANGK